jgi:hypothetical protein
VRYYSGDIGSRVVGQGRGNIWPNHVASDASWHKKGLLPIDISLRQSGTPLVLKLF